MPGVAAVCGYDAGKPHTNRICIALASRRSDIAGLHMLGLISGSHGGE